MNKYRYFIELQYDGSNYHGWQFQNNALTVQEVLEHGFSTILRQKIDVTGCGRTDTGVHASFYVAHFEYDTEIDAQKTTHRLNTFLPKDIVISNIYLVDNEKHARFSASKRTYNYFIHQQKNPFKENYSYHLYGTLNFDAMQKACQYLIGKKDFSSFCKDIKNAQGTMCTVYEAFWEKENNSFKFTISANRFLRNMVRAIVGTLVEIGKEKLQPEDIIKILEQKDRSIAGQSVPGKALFLAAITY